MKAQTPIDLALLRRRLAPLLQRWERQAKRIDALSLRERAFLFLCVVALLVLLFDSQVLAPYAARAKLRSDAQTQQAAEISKLREQFITASGSSAGTPVTQLQAQLEAARDERHRLDEELRHVGAASPAEGLSALLQRVLAQQPGLVLERLTLLDDTPVSLPSAGASAPVAGSPPAAVMPGMSWQGVQLQLQGSYLDTQRYLQALEHEMPTLRWGEMRLTSGGPNEAPRLLARIYLLKVQP
jgi:MSHA biogenesis protein MshJ